jgi:hypothetical protein
MQNTSCHECGERPATQGHICTDCYIRAMEEAHRAFYTPEAMEELANAA